MVRDREWGSGREDLELERTQCSDQLGPKEGHGQGENSHGQGL